MTPTPLRRLLRRTQTQIRYVQPVAQRDATGLVAAVYDQLERDFGMLAPPITLHSPAPLVLAASWALLRETLLADGVLSRAEKEAIATEVSRANDCPYCVEVHAATRDRLRDGVETAAEGACGSAAGAVAAGAVAAERAGVRFTFEYLNRMVSVFLPPSPLPAQMPAAGGRVARRLLGRVAAPDGRVAAGAALQLLPAAAPADDVWVAGHDHVAVARATATIDDIGARVVPADVRTLVVDAVAGGVSVGISKAWLDEPLAALPPAARPAGRLALLTALSPQQVTAADVHAFGAAVAAGGGDRGNALVRLTAWSALTAARAATPSGTTRGTAS